MNQRILLFISLFVFGKYFGYAQQLRAPGIYEEGDTTIEVYDLKELNAIREFKVINGTDKIMFREFNRLTKKLREEGMFTGGYSSGKWKFYNMLGRVKKEINYDNQVKTIDNRMGETSVAALGFDYEKYKADSVVAERYWRMKRENSATSKAIVSAKASTSKPPLDSAKLNVTSMPVTKTGVAPANTDATALAKTNSQKTAPDSAKQKTVTPFFKKIMGSRKEDTAPKNKSGYVPPNADSTAIKTKIPENSTVKMAPSPKKENPKNASGYVPPVADEKKTQTNATAEKIPNAKKEEVVVSKPVESKKETGNTVNPGTSKESAHEKKQVTEKKKNTQPVAKKEESKPITETESKKAAPAPAKEPAPAKKEVAEKKESTQAVAKKEESKPVTETESKKAAPVTAKESVPAKKEFVEKKESTKESKQPAAGKKEATIVNNNTTKQENSSSSKKSGTASRTQNPAGNKVTKTPADTSKPVVSDSLKAKKDSLSLKNTIQGIQSPNRN